MELIQIGTAHTNFKTREETPRSSTDINDEAEISILPEYIDCLKGIGENKYIFVLCWLHQSNRDVHEVHRRQDYTKPSVGVFNSRSPDRPNPISLTRAELVKVTKNSLIVKNLDLVDGTPVIDIKPYIPHYDSE